MIATARECPAIHDFDGVRLGPDLDTADEPTWHAPAASFASADGITQRLPRPQRPPRKAPSSPKALPAEAEPPPAPPARNVVPVRRPVAPLQAVPSFAPTRLRAPLLLASSAGLSAIAAVIIAALSSLAAVSGLVPTAAAVGIGAGLVAVDGGAVALVVAWCTWPRD